MGHLALKEIARTGEQGRGLAIAGLVLGYIVLASFVLLVLVYAVVYGALMSLY